MPRTNYPDEREIDATDNVTVAKGNSTLNFGSEFRWAQDNIIDVDYLHGLFTYSQLADWYTDYARTIGGSPSVGCDSARDTSTGALPCYSNLQQAFGHPQFVYHTNDYAFYAQDDVKLTKTLTLNLGLRYDYEELPKPKIPNPVVPQTAAFPSDRNNVAARVGFAWDSFGTGKTIVHGGFGIYYGRIQNGTIYKALASTGSAQAQFQLNTSPTSSAPPVYPQIVSTAAPPAVSNITVFGKGYQTPYSDQVNLSVQQQLPWNTVFGIAYLGSFGKELPNFVDGNIAPATQTRTISFINGPLTGSQWKVPLYTSRLSTAYNALTLIESNVTSSYNALSVTLDPSASAGCAGLSQLYVFEGA